MSNTYDYVLTFKKKYPMTIAWRLKAHSKIVDEHLYDDEKVLYAFTAQKNIHSYDIINTNVIVLTDKRLIYASKRLLFGYFFTAITPDMFNDLKIRSAILWGKADIDIVKEFATFSNIDKRALSEIQEAITSHMIREKKKYYSRDKKSDE